MGDAPETLSLKTTKIQRFGTYIHKRLQNWGIVLGVENFIHTIFLRHLFLEYLCNSKLRAL